MFFPFLNLRIPAGSEGSIATDQFRPYSKSLLRYWSSGVTGPVVCFGSFRLSACPWFLFALASKRKIDRLDVLANV